MRVQLFEPNQFVVREGEPGTRFYIINEGWVKCVKRNAQGKDEEVLRLHDQEYFGERALLTTEPRAASVIAVTRVECLVLERSDFNGLLGDLEHIMQQEVRRREEMSPNAAQARKQTTRRAAPTTTYAFEDLNIVSATRVDCTSMRP
jgi:CRP-like cAMP-binding protein